MTRRALSCALVVFLIGGSLATVQARGRRPTDEDTDKFPDYNRLEMHPKPKNTEAPPADSVEKSTAPVTRPSLDTPLNFSAAEDSAPKPPPEVVPLPSGASEPPMPEEILNTLGPSTTQSMNR